MPGPIVTSFDGTVRDGENFPDSISTVMARACQGAYREGYQAATEAAQARTVPLVAAAEWVLEGLGGVNENSPASCRALKVALEAYRKGE